MKPVLLVDGNNYFIRAVFSSAVSSETETEVKYELWKYLTFDHLLRFIYKFKAKEVIIAVDGTDIWRKIAYKQYKANRAKVRADSDFDWVEFFKMYNLYLADLKDHLPFKILKLKYCEADDIIAVLAKRLNNVVILSVDSDYTQLTEDHIKVYSPLKKAYLDKNPDFVIMHSLQGLKKDNIQNILTPLDWDENTKRPRFGEKKARKIIAEGLDKWLKDNDLESRYMTLKKLIDFDYIPKYLVNSINHAYDNYQLPDFEKISDFILKYKWKHYIDKIAETEQKLLELY